MTFVSKHGGPDTTKAAPTSRLTPAEVEKRLVSCQWPGHSGVKLAFLGQAPTYDECLTYNPMAGSHGRLFDALLRTAGIDRAECWVGNVFEHKLEQDDPGRHRARVGKERYERQWNEALERLQREFAEARPTVVVPLGGTALLALAGSTSIAAWRGQPRMGTGPFAALKLLPTWAPQALFKQWSLYSVCIADLIRATREAEDGPTIQWPKKRLIIAPSIEQVEDYLSGPCTQTDILSCDIETGWGMIRGMSFAPNQTEGIYVPFISMDRLDRNYWYSAETEKRAWLACKRVLESPVPKLGQNYGGYDVTWLLHKMGIRVLNYREDTRLLHKALYPELNASLAFMGAAYTRQGAWKNFGSHGWTLAQKGDKRDE